MNVLHFHPGRLFGGIQAMLVTLARARDAAPAMAPSFAVCYDEGQLARELRESGVPVFSLGPAQVRFPWQIVRARQRLRKLLAAGNFDAVVCHSSWALAFFGGVVRRARLPLVLWMHNNATVAGRNAVERLAGRMAPDLVICNSRFTANTLPILFPDHVPPHEVILCPVTAAKRAETRTALRAELGVTSPDERVIVQVGRPERWKGHELHLRALALLNNVPGWTCWIVGGAQTPEQTAYITELEGLTRQLDISERVRFFGQRRDVPALLTAADVFCQPNLEPEPFGIVFVEALYAGLPVVSVRHGGVLEIVDETCGRLVPPNDPGALAGALRELLADGDLRASLSAAAPGRAGRVASPANLLPAIHAALTRLTKPRSVPAVNPPILEAHPVT